MTVKLTTEILNNVNTRFTSVTYRVADALIDPGDMWDEFCGASIVLLSHAHFDHIYGLNRIIEINPRVKIFTNEFGKEMLLSDRLNLSRYHGDRFIIERTETIVVVQDGEIISLGPDLSATAVFTPGHNPSCITWIVGDNLFTGDAYIPGIKTVTNLPGGNKQQAINSIETIKQLAIGRTIYPGHKI